RVCACGAAAEVATVRDRRAGSAGAVESCDGGGAAVGGGVSTGAPATFPGGGVAAEAAARAGHRAGRVGTEAGTADCGSGDSARAARRPAVRAVEAAACDALEPLTDWRVGRAGLSGPVCG